MTQRSGKHILAIKVVTYAAKEGDELCIVLVAAHQYFSFFLSIFARTHIIKGKTIVRKIFIFIAQALILRVLVRIASHTLNIVFAKGASIIGEPLEHILALFAI